MKKGFLKKSMVLLLSAICMMTVVGCSGKGEIAQETPVPTTIETTSSNQSDDNFLQVNQEYIDISSANLITEGKLTVGMVIDYPPFEYYASNGGTAIGIDVDIVNAVAKHLGLEVEIKDVPWDDALFTNIGKEYDIVCSAVTITDERLEEMIFSSSYIDNYQSVVVAKNSDISINSFEDLNGLKIAVQKDTVSDELMTSLMSNEDMEIELTENEVATDCFEQLKAGKIDAIVCDSTVTEGQVARNPEDFEEAYRDEANVEKFAIAIGKDNMGLQTAINEALDKLQEEGTSKKIINSWFGN